MNRKLDSSLNSSHALIMIDHQYSLSLNTLHSDDQSNVIVEPSCGRSCSQEQIPLITNQIKFELSIANFCQIQFKIQFNYTRFD